MAKVSSAENDKYEIFSVNADGSVSLAVLKETFPHLTGLRYKYKSKNVARALMIRDGCFHLPLDVKWEDYVFYGVHREHPSVKVESKKKSTTIAEYYELESFEMIVMGVPPLTSTQDFYNYFSQFGKLRQCELRRDPRTGRSKEYGFIKYVSFNDQYSCIISDLKMAGSDMFLRLPTHNLEESVYNRRILVTDITPSVTFIDLLEYFNVFGKITQIFMPHGLNAYAFITFKKEDAVYNILKFGESHRVFGGFVIVERAYSKKESSEVHIRKTFEAQKAQKLRTSMIPENVKSIRKSGRDRPILTNSIETTESSKTKDKEGGRSYIASLSNSSKIKEKPIENMLNKKPSPKEPQRFSVDEAAESFNKFLVDQNSKYSLRRRPVEVNLVKGSESPSIKDKENENKGRGANLSISSNMDLDQEEYLNDYGHSIHSQNNVQEKVKETTPTTSVLCSTTENNQEESHMDYPSLALSSQTEVQVYPQGCKPCNEVAIRRRKKRPSKFSQKTSKDEALQGHVVTKVELFKPFTSLNSLPDLPQGIDYLRSPPRTIHPIPQPQPIYTPTSEYSCNSPNITPKYSHNERNFPPFFPQFTSKTNWNYPSLIITQNNHNNDQQTIRPQHLDNGNSWDHQTETMYQNNYEEFMNLENSLEHPSQSTDQYTSMNTSEKVLGDNQGELSSNNHCEPYTYEGYYEALSAYTTQVHVQQDNPQMILQRRNSGLNINTANNTPGEEAEKKILTKLLFNLMPDSQSQVNPGCSNPTNNLLTGNELCWDNPTSLNVLSDPSSYPSFNVDMDHDGEF